MRSRVGALAALALGAALLAGCGGGGGAKGLPGGASIVPKSAPGFISVTTDRSSPQWQQALDLVKRFPGGSKALAQAQGKDVLSAIGPEFDIALLDLKSSGSDVVLLTQPRNPAKLNKAVSSGTVHTVVDGWTVYANHQSTLEKFQAERSSGSLSDDKAFQDAYANLPAEAIAKAFFSGSVIEQRLQQSLAQSSLPLMSPVSNQSGKLESLSAALVPEQSGVKLHLNANGNLPGSPSTFTPELPAELPSGALLYVSFSDLQSSLKNALKQASQLYPQLDASLAQLETLGGFSVDKDLLPLFGDEGAVAVYPNKSVFLKAGAPPPAPVIDVVFKISDETAAEKVISGVARLARFSKQVKVRTAKGVTQFEVSKTTTISVAVLNGMLVITNQASSLAGLSGLPQTLADDPTYKQAVKGSGLPSHTSGFVYVDTPQAVKYELSSTAQQSQKRVNPVVLTQVSHLQGALLYVDKHGGNYELTGFLGIK
jgi:Protein of unknown function (DUF3352)